MPLHFRFAAAVVLAARLTAALPISPARPIDPAAADRVFTLPGLQDGLKSRTYAGFVEVNSQKNGNLWYMFYESFGSSSGFTSNDDDKPLLIWLNGGPGASSSLGNFLENGPYALSSEDLSLKVNDKGWQSVGHLLYFDQPVGTGFSYCDDDGYVTSLEELGEQFYVGLQSWLAKFPQMRSKRLFITGESFAGVYIPVIAATIHRKNDALAASSASPQQLINLHGVVIGNPGNIRPQQYSFQPAFFKNMGLVNELEYRHAVAIWEECDALMKSADKHERAKAFDKCEGMSNYLLKAASNPFIYDIRQYVDLFTDVYSPALVKFLGDNRTADALHTKGVPWKSGDGTAAPNPVVNHLRASLMEDVSPYYEVLLNATEANTSAGASSRQQKYKVVIYDGVMDGSSCGHVGVFDSLLALNFAGAEAFRLAAKVESTRKAPDARPSAKPVHYGYVQRGGGLEFRWISNAGHLVPTDQPEAAHAMLREILGATMAEFCEATRREGAEVGPGEAAAATVS